MAGFQVEVVRDLARSMILLRSIMEKGAEMPGQIAAGGVRAKIRNHAFELLVSIGYSLVGLNYILDGSSGQRSPLGRALHPYDHLWSSMFLIGGPFIVYGLLAASQRFRVAGLTLLGTGTFMQFIAFTVITPFEPRDLFPLCISLSCLIRGLVAAETVKPVITKYIPWRKTGAP